MQTSWVGFLGNAEYLYVLAGISVILAAACYGFGFPVDVVQLGKSDRGNKNRESYVRTFLRQQRVFFGILCLSIVTILCLLVYMTISIVDSGRIESLEIVVGLSNAGICTFAYKAWDKSTENIKEVGTW